LTASVSEDTTVLTQPAAVYQTGLATLYASVSLRYSYNVTSLLRGAKTSPGPNLVHLVQNSVCADVITISYGNKVLYRSDTDDGIV
jgi:hypothetical protein